MKTEIINAALNRLMEYAHVRNNASAETLANDADEQLDELERHVMTLENEVKILTLENQVYAALMCKMRAAVDECLGMCEKGEKHEIRA